MNVIANAGIDYVNTSTKQILIQRFRNLRDKLRERFHITNEDFTKFVVENEKQFNTPKGHKAIYNAWYLITPNVRLNELLNDYEKKLS